MVVIKNSFEISFLHFCSSFHIHIFLRTFPIHISVTISYLHFELYIFIYIFAQYFQFTFSVDRKTLWFKYYSSHFKSFYLHALLSFTRLFILSSVQKKNLMKLRWKWNYENNWKILTSNTFSAGYMSNIREQSSSCLYICWVLPFIAIINNNSIFSLILLISVIKTKSIINNATLPFNISLPRDFEICCIFFSFNCSRGFLCTVRFHQKYFLLNWRIFRK